MPERADDDPRSVRLGEERECQRDDDGGDGTLTYEDDLSHVDRDLDVGRRGRDNSAVGAVDARRVWRAVRWSAGLKRWQQ